MTAEELLEERVKELRCLYDMCLLAAQAPDPAHAARGVAQALVRAMRCPSQTECLISLACEPGGETVEKRTGTCPEARHAIEAEIVTREKAGSSRWLGRIVLRCGGADGFLTQEKSLLDSVANIMTSMLETQVMIGDLASKNAALRELVLLANELSREASATGATPGKTSGLSPRERQVAAQVREGRTSKEIGALLGISTATVERHRHNIRKKLGVDRTEYDLAGVLSL